MHSDDVFDHLLARRLIFLTGPLDGARADAAAAQLLHLDTVDPGREITLHLNCPAADPRAALAVYDLMQSVRSAVRTLCLGVAVGGAALVLAGGVPGGRAALPNARISLHDPRQKLTGTLGELDVQTRELLRLRQQIHELVAKHTGQPRERVERDAERELWLSAAEARVYGLIDEVLQPGSADQDPDRPRRRS
jgi:ATP-dependent Clp protease protease subunit